MQIQTKTKWDKIRDFVNIWLKDPQVYCGNCDQNFNENMPLCCEHPLHGTNFTFTKDVVELVKDLQKEQLNTYGSNKKKDFRSSLKLPSRLLRDLDALHRKEWGYKLFGKKGEIAQFMKKMPMFRIAERV